jgi:transposase
MDSPKSVDSRREQAIALRRAGKSRRGIKEILGITSNETLVGQPVRPEIMEVIVQRS